MPFAPPCLRSPARRLAGLALTLLLLIALAQAPVASALPGSSSLSTGFDSDTLVFTPGLNAEWFPRMAGEGATWVRIPADWADIAPRTLPRGFNATNPSDPHYDWSYLDSAVEEAAAARLNVLLVVASPPRWALGRGAPRSTPPGTWRPDPNAYGEFARALATRYSGHFADPANPGRTLPQVTHFQAWNEPNLTTQLEPQWTRSGRSFRPASPIIYRRLLNALYGAVKAVQPHAYVLAAGLAPYGDPPGTGRMHPVSFLRELLCLGVTGRCSSPPHFDAIDFHPYALTPTMHAYSPEDVSVPDAGRLTPLLRAAARAGTAQPRGPKSVWMTEIGWGSNPPDPGAPSLGRQAQYVSLSFYELWRQGVSHVFWYEVPDPPGASSHFPPVGIFFRSGVPKPAVAAYRFPFVALSASPGQTILWGRAPQSGPVTIEVFRGHRWVSWIKLATTSGGVFYAQRRSPAAASKVRALSGTVASYPWPAA